MTTKHIDKNDRCTVSVMSFNLRFGLADDGSNSWQNRQHAFPAFFKKYSPDFLGVQEANDFQSRLIDSLLPGHTFTGMYQTQRKFWQDNLIFYHQDWQCHLGKRYFLSNTPAAESKLDESKWPRQCIIGLFEKKGKRLIHVNTHFDFKESVQKRSAELVLSFLSEFPAGVPVIVTGDFNSPPDSSAHRIFMSGGFQDAFAGNHSYTYHRFTGKKSGEHIDWILYKGDIRVKKSEVIRGKFADRYPSDHYPVSAEFIL